MEILVKEEKCDPNTHIWIDQDKGNRRYLPALIKYLHSQGYYKNGQLTNNQVLDIIKNTFKWNIGIDSVKKAKPKNYVFKFIPTASKLNLK